MSAESSYSKQDPDYETPADGPSVSQIRQEEQSKRDKTVLKIKRIIERQYDNELHAKEEEIMHIDSKISQSKNMLDKLRAYLLANYYGYDSKLVKGSSWLEKRKRKRGTKKSDSTNTVQLNSSSTRESPMLEKASSEQPVISSITQVEERDPLEDNSCPAKTQQSSDADTETAKNRFYVTKKVIVGNISKFIPLDKREKNDQSTHKWMVYVRAPPDQPDLNSFVKRVWFFLHPSYMPNDIIEITRPPFTVTRRGWGEFPVRIQLIFCDPRNKPVDIIHNLKLDKTYTGLQTLGAETTVLLEMQRHAVLSKDAPIPAKQLAPSVKYASSFVAKKEETVNAILKVDSEGKSTTSCAPMEVETQNTEAGHKYQRTGSVEQAIASLPDEAKFKKIIKSVTSASSICSNESGSRPVSPANGITKTDDAVDEVTLRALTRNVHNFPLLRESEDPNRQPYCAGSFEQYKSWSHSKRRAAEWQRALDLKRALLKNDSFFEEMTTKQLMIWCRRHGHTPPESNTSVVKLDLLDYCPCCGKSFILPTAGDVNAATHANNWCSNCLSKRNFNYINSLTSFEDFVNDISEREYKLGLVKNDRNYDMEPEHFVDVMGCGEESSEDNSNDVRTSDASDEVSCSSDCTPMTYTLEMDWIFEAAAQIEVHLPLVSFGNTHIPLLQHMLLIAMKSFVTDILTHSYCVAKQSTTSNEPVVVTPIHIHHLLRKCPEFDFLTNHCLGIQEEDGDL
eukprot:gene16162-17785_t